jgi:hypothetical protein
VKVKRSTVSSLLAESEEWRTFFKAYCEYSAFRLRAQAYRFRDELASRGHVAPLDEVQDTLFELARDLSPDDKERADLSDAWQLSDAMGEACKREDLAAFKEALAEYEREALDAIGAARERSGAA